MVEHQLPDPVGREDAYLAAILDELKAQHEKVAALGKDVATILRILARGVEPAVLEPVVELREPAEAGSAVEMAEKHILVDAQPQPEMATTTASTPDRKQRKRKQGKR